MLSYEIINIVHRSDCLLGSFLTLKDKKSGETMRAIISHSAAQKFHAGDELIVDGKLRDCNSQETSTVPSP